MPDGHEGLEGCLKGPHVGTPSPQLCDVRLLVDKLFLGNVVLGQAPPSQVHVLVDGADVLAKVDKECQGADVKDTEVSCTGSLLDEPRYRVRRSRTCGKSQVASGG